MKQVAIFDNSYVDSQSLEKDVNEWIKENQIENIINVDVKTYICAFNDEICQDGTEQTVNCVIWYAILIYEF